MNDRIIIRNIEPQEITIDGSGGALGITNVYVNGVDVTVGTKAYVIVPTKTSELTNDSGFITSYTETDPTVPSYVKEITMADINNWNDKQNELVSGSNIKTINGNTLLGSGNLNITPEYTAGVGIDITSNTISNTITSYNDLTDLPTPIQYTSQLVNDSGFITNSVDDLQNYLSTLELDKILPKTSDSGTDLYLSDSAEVKIDFKLKPSEIQQHTTTGKNLMPRNNLSSTSTAISDVTFVGTENGTILTSGTASDGISLYILDDWITLPAGTYTISDGIASGQSGTTFFFYADVRHTDNTPWDEKAFSTATPSQITRTIEDSFIYKPRIVVRTGVNMDGLEFKPMLETGSSQTTYEEYTGGMPSPNPLYPQDIHVVTGENSITISNKNLFDKSTIAAGDVANGNQGNRLSSRQDLYLKAGTYTFSCNIESPYRYAIQGQTVGAPPLVSYPTFTYDSGWKTSSYQTTTFTLTGDCWIDIAFSKEDNSGLVVSDVSGFNYQLEKGSPATSYVPYQSQEYPIDLGTWDYLKIGDISDRIFKNVLSDPDYMSNVEIGKWCRRDNIYPVYLAYIGDFTSVVDNGDKYSFYNNNATDIPRRDVCENPYGKSIYFNNVADGNNNIIESTGLGTVRIDMDKKVGISTLEDLTQWISDNQVVVYFPLKSGYFYGKGGVGDTLDSQLNDLTENNTAYDGGTIINQENDDLPFDIEASTYKKISS